MSQPPCKYCAEKRQRADPDHCDGDVANGPTICGTFCELAYILQGVQELCQQYYAKNSMQAMLCKLCAFAQIADPLDPEGSFFRYTRRALQVKPVSSFPDPTANSTPKSTQKFTSPLVPETPLFS